MATGMRFLTMLVGAMFISTATYAGPIGEVVDHYMVYKAKGSKKDSLGDPVPDQKFPKDFNITLRDAVFLDALPDNPENYNVQKEKDVASPGMKNDEDPATDPSRHYIVYQIKNGKEGVGPVDSKGKFPKPEKHVKRRVELDNQFGTLSVETKKQSFLWVPAAMDEFSAPGSIGDKTHYMCYQVKESKTAPFGTQQDPSKNGKFIKDLQAFFGDDLFTVADCAVNKDGNISFEFTPAEGKCLYDLKKPKLLCNPTEKTNVEPPRETVANVTESLPGQTVTSLMCYQAKRASKIVHQASADLVTQVVGTKLRQNKHIKRTAVFATPSNNFPVPTRIDTKGEDFLCVPSLVTSISAL